MRYIHLPLKISLSLKNLIMWKDPAHSKQKLSTDVLYMYNSFHRIYSRTESSTRHCFVIILCKYEIGVPRGNVAGIRVRLCGKQHVRAWSSVFSFFREINIFGHTNGCRHWLYITCFNLELVLCFALTPYLLPFSTLHHLRLQRRINFL